VKTSLEAAIESLGQFNGSYGKLTSIVASVEAWTIKHLLLS
jgi:hypothetical protein